MSTRVEKIISTSDRFEVEQSKENTGAKRRVGRPRKSEAAQQMTNNSAKAEKPKAEKGRRYRPVSERMAKPVSPRMLATLELMNPPGALGMVVYRMDSQESSAKVVYPDGTESPVRWDALHTCRLRGFFDWMKGPELGDHATVVYIMNKDGREALRTGQG